MEIFFVSHDAVELYPSIMIEDALQLLEEKRTADTKWAWKTDLTRQEILKLVRLLISQPHFQCELGFFQQAKGTPIPFIPHKTDNFKEGNDGRYN